MSDHDFDLSAEFDPADFDSLQIDILDTSASAGFPEGGASSRSWPTCSCSCSCPGVDLT